MAAAQPVLNRYVVSMSLLLLAMLGHEAQADIAVSIERINDRTAIISAMGTLTTFDDLGGRAIFRFVDDPLAGAFPSATTAHTLSNNSLTAGGTSLISASTLVGSPVLPDNFFLRMSGQPADGSAFGGIVQVDLNEQIWADVGTTGDVIWGNASNKVGVWSIVAPTAIPEPSCAVALAVFASVVGCCRRRIRSLTKVPKAGLEPA